MNCVPTGSAFVPVYSKYALFSPPVLANSGIDKALSPTEAAKEIKINVPLVVRLAGTNHEEGKKILDNSNLKIISASNLSNAAEKIVKAIK